MWRPPHNLARYLQSPVAEEKLEGPITKIIFIVEMTLRLPAKTFEELRDLISSWIGKKLCCKRELQSLAGELQHACKVVRPGRTFLRRVFELMKGASIIFAPFGQTSGLLGILEWGGNDCKCSTVREGDQCVHRCIQQCGVRGMVVDSG